MAVNNVLDFAENRNRFIIFYILKELWKQHKYSMDELYRTVGISRTCYTKILSMNDVDLSGTVERLETITDVSQYYWSGYKEYKITLHSWEVGEQGKIWREFIDLRSQRKPLGEKDEQLKDIEQLIKKKIYHAAQDTILQDESEPFKRLVYFTTYKQKRSEKTADELIENARKALRDIKYRTLEHASAETLKLYRQEVGAHYRRIEAFITLKDWKQI